MSSLYANLSRDIQKRCHPYNERSITLSDASKLTVEQSYLRLRSMYYKPKTGTSVVHHASLADVETYIRELLNDTKEHTDDNFTNSEIAGKLANDFAYAVAELSRNVVVLSNSYNSVKYRILVSNRDTENYFCFSEIKSDGKRACSKSHTSYATLVEYVESFTGVFSKRNVKINDWAERFTKIGITNVEEKKYADMFTSHEITKDMVQCMTDYDYKEIGVTIIGDRVLMRTKLKDL